MPQNHKRGFAPIIVLLVIAVIGLSGYVFYKDVAPNIKISYSNQKNTPSPTPLSTPSPTQVATPTPVPSVAPVVNQAPPCVKVKTYGMFDNDPEFEAEKCYSRADAAALDDAIRKYNNAIFNYNAAANQANVTCQGFTDSFKQQCDQSKQDADKYKKEMDLYKAQIHAIIGRGKQAQDFMIGHFLKESSGGILMAKSL